MRQMGDWIWRHLALVLMTVLVAGLVGGYLLDYRTTRKDAKQGATGVVRIERQGPCATKAECRRLLASLDAERQRQVRERAQGRRAKSRLSSRDRRRSAGNAPVGQGSPNSERRRGVSTPQSGNGGPTTTRPTPSRPRPGSQTPSSPSPSTPTPTPTPAPAKGPVGRVIDKVDQTVGPILDPVLKPVLP